MGKVTTGLSLKEKQRQERETLILKAAEDIFIEKGYHETSIDEIAVRVGIAKGTFYLHFPSKEDLVIKLFKSDMEKFLEVIETIVAAESTARAKLEGILTFMYGSFFSKRAQLLYSIYSNPELRRVFFEKKSCMYDLWEHLTESISQVLEEGKASHEFDPSLPTSVMLSTFYSLLSPRIYERLIVQEQMPADELVKYLGHIFFKGITTI